MKSHKKQRNSAWKKFAEDHGLHYQSNLVNGIYSGYEITLDRPGSGCLGGCLSVIFIVLGTILGTLVGSEMDVGGSVDLRMRVSLKDSASGYLQIRRRKRYRWLYLGDRPRNFEQLFRTKSRPLSFSTKVLKYNNLGQQILEFDTGQFSRPHVDLEVKGKQLIFWYRNDDRQAHQEDYFTRLTSLVDLAMDIAKAVELVSGEDREQG